MTNVTALRVGMLARPAPGPSDLFHPRPHFQRVESITTDGGWVTLRFADGTEFTTREHDADRVETPT